jgi:hypothetical protein
MGLKVYDVDTKISTVTDVRKVLGETNCKAIYFQPTTETTDNLLLLRKSIPEFFHCKSLSAPFCLAADVCTKRRLSVAEYV